MNWTSILATAILILTCSQSLAQRDPRTEFEICLLQVFHSDKMKAPDQGNFNLVIENESGRVYEAHAGGFSARIRHNFGQPIGDGLPFNKSSESNSNLYFEIGVDFPFGVSRYNGNNRIALVNDTSNYFALPFRNGQIGSEAGVLNFLIQNHNSADGRIEAIAKETFYPLSQIESVEIICAAGS